MTDYRSSKYGYIPHSDQSKVFCTMCGNDLFETYSQSINIDAEVWCWEHVCTKCGHSMAIEIKKK